ncbi:MAG: STT3 domain-containing protein [Candidatus Omnitrophota bacterium]
MKKYILIGISLIFVLGVNIYFRSFPINFPQLKIQAKAKIEDKLQKRILADIEKRFPDLSPSVKEKAFLSVVKDYKKKNLRAIKKEVTDEYQVLKSRYQDSRGQTYLMELDCWHWARFVENILVLGHPGDQVIKGKQFDSLMLAPSGTYLSWNQFLFYLSAGLYKIFAIFKPIPVFDFLFYLPIFFSAIFIIVLYLFCWRYFGNICAIVASLFVGLSSMFLQRSCAGWFDSDVLNLLFPLIIVWAYLLVYKAGSYRAGIFWLLLSAFFLGLFSFAWSGWLFIFLVLVLYEIYSLLNLASLHWQYKQKNPKQIRRHVLSLVLFILFSFLWIRIISGPVPLQNFYYSVKLILSLNKALTADIWPNVFSTVAEVKKGNAFSIAASIGPPFLLLVALFSMLGLFLAVTRGFRYSGFKREIIIVLVFWFLSMFFACSKGIRFAMFLVVPLGISLGWGLNEAFSYFQERGRHWLGLMIILLVAALCAGLVRNASHTAQGIFPLMNDSWYNLLSAIKEKTPQSAIINSWWDFGDFFKVVSRRKVIFDGQSQAGPQAYWMANTLLSDNEDQALGILRMLNNGGNQAYDLMSPYFKDRFKQILLLKRVMALDRQKAAKALAKYLPAKAAGEVIEILFAKPAAKAYFVVDYSMKWKIPAISYLGRWDFNKVYLAQVLGRKKQSQIVQYLIGSGASKQEARKLYREGVLNQTAESWISSRLKFHTDLVTGQKKSDDLVLFDNGYVYSPKSRDIYLYSCRNTRFKIPQSLFIFNQTKLDEVKYAKNDLDWSALIINNSTNYEAMLLDRDLAESLFTRLYFFNGQGLKHFKPLIEEKDGDNYIRVFEIVWD